MTEILSEEQIRHGFWNCKLSDAWPPKHVTYFEDLTSSETLSLNITQLDGVNAYGQKKIIDRWCHEIPRLDEVRYLWFVSRVNQRMLDAACKMPNLEGLFVKWSGIKNIDALVPLAGLRNLKCLAPLNTRLKDRSFDPVLKFFTLIRFESSWNYPESEFEKLKNLPGLKYGNIETSWKELKARLNEGLK